MRNLKKILALVLAFVMTMSLVTVASAAEESVSANYAEAVEVLQDMGVFQGYEDGSFGGKNLITREEVATVLYRIISEDVDDVQKGLYVEACDFTDVAATRWSAGFIGYCANGGYVKGYAGKFNPKDNVTGYQVLAMALRAIGYDKNGEFTGNDWTKNVAATAQQLGILKNVSKNVVLSEPATRELVAELLFRTIATVPQVTYTPAFGYQPVVDNISKNNVTLGYENFLLEETEWGTQDKYGRPGYTWIFDIDNDNISGTWYETTVIEDVPYATFYTATTECEIAAARGYTGTTPFYANIWVNGSPIGTKATPTTYAIESYDMISTLGAQGRALEVYADRLVMVDTFLARVVNVTPVLKDAAGHKIQNSMLSLYVYDGSYDTLTTNSTNVVVASKTSDWTYAIGDYVLVNGVTAQSIDANKVDVFGNADLYENVLSIASTDVLGLAESFTGKQSALHYYEDKHTIDGTIWNDAAAYELDEAGNVINNFTWFKDQHGNIIGSAIIANTYEYGVISNIQWLTQVAGFGYAQANVTLIDGTTKTIVVSALYDANDSTALEATLGRAYTTEGNLTEGEAKTVSTEYGQNAEFIGTELYRIADNGNGTHTLVNIENALVNVGKIVADEATNVTVRKGNAIMIGGKVVDSNTKFLFGYNVGNVAYFKTVAYTGFNTIASLNDAKVDYVDLNGDSRIDLAYVYGTRVDVATAGLFYMTQPGHVQQLFDENGLVNAYVIPGYFNGAEGSIKIKNDAYGQWLIGELLADWSNNTNNKHALYQVDIDNGYVTNFLAVTTTDAALTTAYNTLTPGAYTWTGDYYYLGNDGRAVRFEGSATDYALYNGDVLTLVNTTTGITETFDVTAATRVFGDLKANVRYGSNYVVHVVYDNWYGDKNALEVYVFAYPTIGGTTGTIPGVAAYDVDLDAAGLVVTVTLADDVVANTTFTVQYLNASGVLTTGGTGVILAGNNVGTLTLSTAATAAIVTINGRVFNVTPATP